MKLSDLRTEVLEAIKEKLSPKGLVPDQATLDRWINRAQRWYWRRGLERNALPWEVDSDPVTFTAQLGEMLVAKFADPTLDESFGAGAFGSYVDRIQYLQARLPGGGEDDWRSIDPFTARDRALHERRGALLAAGELPRGWYVSGDILRFAPTPTNDLEVRATYLPGINDLAAADDEPWGGRFPEFHDLIVYKAAQLLSRKGESAKTAWDVDVAELEQDFYRKLRKDQGMLTRRIRPVSHYGRR